VKVVDATAYVLCDGAAALGETVEIVVTSAAQTKATSVLRTMR
jgi:hypothetical protein